MKPFAKTVFLPALVLFALVNVLLMYLLPTDAASLFSMQRKDLSWWTIKSFLALDKRPSIVLIGSSVMTKISNEGDATYLNSVLDARTHHRSQYLEDLLVRQRSSGKRSSGQISSEQMSSAQMSSAQMSSGRMSSEQMSSEQMSSEQMSSGQTKSLYCASLSVPGMNASDVTIASYVLLNTDRKPDLIVYGIAPRDLMDNGLSMPSQTSTFRLLEKTADLSAVGYESRIGFDAKFKYFVNSLLRKVVPLYRYQEEIALKMQHWCQKETRQLPIPENSVLSQKVQLALNMVPDEVEAPINSLPFDPNRREHTDLSNCYIASYNPFRKELYQTQSLFLSRFLETAHSRGIKVLLVNMPLRHDSFKLMPPGFYGRYMKDITEIASRNNASLLDLQKNQSFTSDDFVDQVHLSGAGGCKWVRCLAESITSLQLLDGQPSVKLADKKSPTIQ